MQKSADLPVAVVVPPEPEQKPPPLEPEQQPNRSFKTFQDELEGIGIWCMNVEEADLRLLTDQIRQHPLGNEYKEYVLGLGADEDYEVGQEGNDYAMEVEDFQQWLHTTHKIEWSACDALSQLKASRQYIAHGFVCRKVCGEW